MIVKYSRNNTQTEIPCEANPELFARKLIVEAEIEHSEKLNVEEEFKLCTVDGAPLR